MDKQTIIFELERDTPNTKRYKEKPPKGQPPVSGSIYLQKWLEPPDRIEVTISEA